MSYNGHESWTEYQAALTERNDKRDAYWFQQRYDDAAYAAAAPNAVNLTAGERHARVRVGTDEPPLMPGPPLYPDGQPPKMEG